MATRSRVQGSDLDLGNESTSEEGVTTSNKSVIDDIDITTDGNNDLPPEFNTDSSPSVGLSEEELLEGGFDDRRDEAERTKIDPPAGDWEKEDRWEYKRFTLISDQMPGDIDPAGRTFFNVSGKPRPRTVGDTEYEPMLFLRISPDKRMSQSDPSRVDNAFKCFLLAKDVYLAVKGETVQTRKQLIDFLTEDDYVVRTMKGENGPNVIGIKVPSRLNKRSR